MTEEFVGESQRLGAVESEMQELKLATQADIHEMITKIDGVRMN